MRTAISRLKHVYHSTRYYLAQWKSFGLSNAIFLYLHGKKTNALHYNTIFPDDQIVGQYKELAKKASAKREDYVLVNVTNDELSPVIEHAFLIWASESDADIVYGDSIEMWNPQSKRFAEQRYVFKPDFGIDTYRAQQYIGGVCYIKKKWIEQYASNGITEPEMLDEVIFRVWEEGGIISHIQRVLSFHAGPVQYSYEGRESVVASHLKRCKLDAKKISTDKDVLKIQYTLRKPHEKVSIIIPNKDNVDVLQKCIDSILDKTSYDNYEIVVIENNSTEDDTFNYYKEIQRSERVRVITCVTNWNYSFINNYGVREATGKYYLLLNNDTEVIAPDWVEQMLQYAQRKDVGAVGAKLFFSDGTIQHAGVTVGIRGVAGHAFRLWSGDDRGYMNRLVAVSNMSAVTAACMMVRKDVFDQVGGFDEKLEVAFNDVDLCLRIRKKGYNVVYTPEAKLFHHESKSRGSDQQAKDKQERFNRECAYFCKKHYRTVVQGDPYYNTNLSLDSDDFELIGAYKV